jgi:hypothetical protein
MPPKFYLEAESLSDLDVFVLTLFGEASAGDILGAIGVGNVIMNRSQKRQLLVRAVCHQPLQFSCWNGSKGTGVERMRWAMKSLVAGDASPWLHELRWLAKGLLAGDVMDRTHGAQHYLAVFLYDSPSRPPWAKKMQAVATFGGHVFLKEMS